MNWRDIPSLMALRAFSALAESGGASAAGAMLNVSHAAVSQHIRALERDLGVKLVRREGRGLALTSEGEALARILQNAFGSIAEGVAALRRDEDERDLRVSTTPAFAAHWLMPRIGAFRRAHPEIGFILDPSTDLVDLSPGGAEIAIRFGEGGWTGLDSELLIQSDFAIVAAPSLIGDREISSPSDLLDLPWLQELGTQEVDDWLQSKGVTERRMARVVSLPGTLILDAVMRGDGVTATARAFVRDELQKGSLRLLFSDRGDSSGYHLVTPRRPMRRAARAFLAWLRREAAASDDRRR